MTLEFTGSVLVAALILVFLWRTNKDVEKLRKRVAALEKGADPAYPKRRFVSR